MVPKAEALKSHNRSGQERLDPTVTRMLDSRKMSTEERAMLSSNDCMSSETAKAKERQNFGALKHSDAAETLIKSSGTGIA